MTHKHKMAQGSLEEQVKTLQKHMGAILVTVRDLKASVDALKRKDTTKENKEIKEIMDAQIIVDKVIGANKDAIKRIDEQIKQIVDNKLDTKTYHASDKAKEDGGKYGVEDKTRKKCRYYDRGFCKYNKKCRFSHQEGICQVYLKTLKCGLKECCQRHPKLCRWDQGKGGCNKGEDCLYPHKEERLNINVDNVNTMGSEEYHCVSCKHIWEEKNCVKEHIIQNTKVFFCLNCDDWVKEKGAVFGLGWSLFDQAGYLRVDI